MAIRTTKQWYFGKEDKEQIKSYSKDISKIFKIRGYNPERDGFEDYFESLEDFDFIPCIREALDYTDYEEEVEDVTMCLDEAYDSSVNVTLEELKKNAEEQGETLKDRLMDIYSDSSKTSDDLIKFILTCDDEVKQNFIDFIMK